MAEKQAEPNAKPVCGIVIPISAIDTYSEAHWTDVRAILEETITSAGFQPRIVSDAEDVGVIHKRIIQHLYDDPIVVCDISAKNPNVMFELGMRLAFDKPTIIVKDDKTAYSFDTGAIEHLEYPVDLRFNLIVDFKAKLAAKIKATYEKATTDPSFTPFLKNFGEFTVAKLEKKEVSGQEYILEELRNIHLRLDKIQAGTGLQNRVRVTRETASGEHVRSYDPDEFGIDPADHKELVQVIAQLVTVKAVSYDEQTNLLKVIYHPGTEVSGLNDLVRTVLAFKQSKAAARRHEAQSAGS